MPTKSSVQVNATSDKAREQLTEFALMQGHAVLTSGNQPIQLENPNRVWFVECGTLDIFLVGQRDGSSEAPFQHVIRLNEGSLAFGAKGFEEMRLVAKGLPGTKLRELPITDLVQEQGENSEDILNCFYDDVDTWVSGMLATIASKIIPRPRSDVLLRASESKEVDGTLSSVSGVLWLDGEAQLFGTEESEEDELVPITPDSWAVMYGVGSVSAHTTKSVSTSTLLSSTLPAFHRLVFQSEIFNRKMILADQANLRDASLGWRQRDETQAREHLLGLLAPDAPRVSSGNELIAAIRMVAKQEHIKIREPVLPAGELPVLQDIVRVSGVRTRKVLLSTQDRWWRTDSGALLAYRNSDHSPVALLPGWAGTYRLFDPKTGRFTRVTREIAKSLEEDAWMLYRPLPDDSAIGMKDLFAGASGRFASDIARVVITGLAASILALVPAAGAGYFIRILIPQGVLGGLVQFVLLLGLFAFTAALAQVLRGTALMRIEARLSTRLTAAVWDRLLRLTNEFYRKHSSGDLALRVQAFQSVRDKLAGTTAAALLSAVFMLPSIGLVFFFDIRLGWMSLGAGVVALFVMLLLGLMQIPAQREKLLHERALTSLLSQFISCISKLQTAGAEGTARGAWARLYREQKSAEIRVGVLSEHLAAFGAAVPPLAAAALFTVAGIPGAGGPDVGDFLVVYLASMVFYAAIIAFGSVLDSVSSVVPAAEQVTPILRAVPDTGTKTNETIVLQGELRIEEVSFGYGPSGAQILDRVSIHAKPSEFIAIVGESGAGKSTLIRLALGLEIPRSGAVYYDGIDLKHLDSVAVRRQIGVVLQDQSVQVGTVLNAIIGLDHSLTIDDAWRAAKLAAVDQDIAAMPMGMYTPMSEQSNTVSGGQIQRIRIAQALVKNPRLLIMDEATNWLDRKNQAAVMNGVRESSATRIVIAHRISTIREAHRIYVLEQGRVVQVGRFDELAEQDGAFQNLIRRQMT